MRIVQIITSLNQGGAQTLLENLTYGLRELDQDVIVISLESHFSATAKRIEERGIRVIYLDKKPHYDPSITGKLGRVLEELKPDIIHAHNIRKAYVFLAAGKERAGQIVYTVHNMAWQEQNRAGGLFSLFMFHSGTMVPVGISPMVTRSIRERYHLKTVPTICNGTDLRCFTGKRDYRLQEAPCILNIARLDPQKNHARLIEAFAVVRKKVPNAVLMLVGDGELMDAAKSQVREEGLSACVRFEGLRDDIPACISSADVFCLSSDYEGMPMTLIEAMAGGLPIVSTAVGGVPDMLQNEESALLTGTDSAELAGALVRVLTDESLRRKIGTNAYKESKRFSHRRMAKKYLHLYEKILKRRTDGTARI